MEEVEATHTEQQLLTPPQEVAIPPGIIVVESAAPSPEKSSPPSPSPPPFDDTTGLPPSFEDAQSDLILDPSGLLDDSSYQMLEAKSIPGSPSSSVAAEVDDDYQKLDTPEGSLSPSWPDNSFASPDNSDFVPTDMPTADFEEIPGQ